MRTDQRTSVVILDPFEDERDMYAMYLRAAGFDVWAHEHAAEAWRTLATQRADAIILRLRQLPPGASGIDFVRELRQSRATCHLAVVMITTSMRHEDEDAACRAGTDSYLLLPVRPDEMVAEVQRVMRLGRRPAALRRRGAIHREHAPAKASETACS